MDPEDAGHQKLCSLKGGRELGHSCEVQSFKETVHNEQAFCLYLGCKKAGDKYKVWWGIRLGLVRVVVAAASPETNAPPCSGCRWGTQRQTPLRLCPGSVTRAAIAEARYSGSSRDVRRVKRNGQQKHLWADGIRDEQPVLRSSPRFGSCCWASLIAFSSSQMRMPITHSGTEWFPRLRKDDERQCDRKGHWPSDFVTQGDRWSWSWSGRRTGMTCSTSFTLYINVWFVHWVLLTDFDYLTWYKHHFSGHCDFGVQHY